MSKHISFAEAAALIPDNAVVSVSSSSGLGCPDMMLKAIGERFDETGHPQNITTLHPIAAGDMSGIRGVDYIAKKGLLKKILAGSYPSGPSSAEPPLIWQMITNNEIPAYNIPSGILFDMHREAAARRPGVLTKVGLDTFVDPKRQGTAMNDKAREAPVVKRVSFEGEDWLYFPAIAPQVAIIRATTADERGNLTYEHEGATLGGLDQALAARNNGGIVIAQVKRIAREGTLKPHDVRVPGVLVDYIVVDPDQKQTTQTLYDPAISGEIFRPLDTFRLPEFNIQKAIARRVAQELQAGSAVQSGFWHFRQCTAHSAGRGPAWCGDMGNRAGGGRRCAASGFCLWLCVQCRRLYAVALSVHLFSGGRASMPRSCPSLRSGATARSMCRSSPSVRM
ncbi:hypothetical protein C028_01901 [Brucella abortus 63/168]|nr:hypothetical protein C028_01901 [Brucella abortus 63/168]